jgi:hemerythrin
MPLLIWGPMYQVGVQEIDNQHYRLVELANELAEAVRAGKGGDVLPHVYNGLHQYIMTHFSMEEQLMTHHHYPANEEHRQQHRDLTQAVNAFKQRITSRETELVYEAMQFFSDWLSKHIMASDKALAHFMLQKTSETQPTAVHSNQPETQI